MIKKTLNSFSNALNGLKLAWIEELNFKIEVVALALVIFCITYFHFTIIESSFLIIAATFVLASEIINTAIEDLCNKVEPNEDPIIKKVKDLSSAFVLVSVIGSVIIGIYVFINHFR